MKKFFKYLILIISFSFIVFGTTFIFFSNEGLLYKLIIKDQEGINKVVNKAINNYKNFNNIKMNVKNYSELNELIINEELVIEIKNSKDNVFYASGIYKNLSKDIIYPDYYYKIILEEDINSQNEENESDRQYSFTKNEILNNGLNTTNTKHDANSKYYELLSKIISLQNENSVITNVFLKNGSTNIFSPENLYLFPLNQVNSFESKTTSKLKGTNMLEVEYRLNQKKAEDGNDYYGIKIELNLISNKLKNIIFFGEINSKKYSIQITINEMNQNNFTFTSFNLESLKIEE